MYVPLGSGLSEDRRRPRSGRRFGFDGPRRHTYVREEDVSVDDILDSLSRRAELSDGLGRAEITRVEDGFDGEVASERTLLPIGSRGPQHSIGKYMFALLLLGGVLIVGLYGALKSVTEPSMILRLVQNPAFVSVFTDPLKLGLVALFCVIPLLIVRRRRRVQDRLLFT